jgi:hypothetical protein
MRALKAGVAIATAIAVTVAVAAAGWALMQYRERAAAPSAGAALVQRDLLGVPTASALCTAANAVGVGLQGSYFEGERWSGRVLLERLDPLIDFAPGLALPPGAAAAQSVRWRGWIKAPLSGKFRFHATAPGLSIRVANQPAAGEGAPEERAVDMAAGRFYPIQIELARSADIGQALRLEWTAPHGARYVVPKALLFAPTDNVRS